jgi:ubiquinone/menaquinone biosynthesis C-methylase UbiE
LRQCYEIALPRVQQYLVAEIAHVLKSISPTDRVLELGCGYGRVLTALAQRAGDIAGIDNSAASLQMARRDVSHVRLVQMDAVRLGFRDDSFDKTVCVQNGISAFHVDQTALIHEAMRVTKPGGMVFFSSYSEKFWPFRLQWFRAQAAAGLIGKIDEAKTGNGVIVCTDGFSATTVDEDGFRALTAGLGADVRISEVDESSLFCEIRKRGTTE